MVAISTRELHCFVLISDSRILYAGRWHGAPSLVRTRSWAWGHCQVSIARQDHCSLTRPIVVTKGASASLNRAAQGR